MSRSLLHLRLLAIFAAIVKAGSLIGAARSLGMSRSKVSEALKMLEEELGLRLIERTTRNLHITVAGQAVYEECAKILETTDDAFRVGHAFSSEPTGTLRITAPSDFGISYLGPICAAYCKMYPDVQLSLLYNHGVFDFVEDRIDLAFRVMINPKNSLVTRKYYSVKGLIYAAPSLIEKYGPLTEIKQLSDLPWINLDLGIGFGADLRDAETGDVFTRPNGSFHESDSVSGAMSLAEAGLGVVVLPSFMSGLLNASDRVKQIFPTWAYDGPDIRMVFPSQRQLPAKTRAFIDLAVEMKH